MRVSAATAERVDEADAIQRRLARLLHERERLRVHGAEPRALEVNRREIAARQHELSRALIRRYGRMQAKTEAPAIA
ncbi:MAG: hypothetical protein M3377_03780 [Actinomycetota bacterium]|nr:hypothetical protein [Actinomycetota bacterium]